MTFRVGQKVVCVDADFSIHAAGTVNFPAFRGVYVVRGIVNGRHKIHGHGPGLLLEEIHNPIGPRGIEFNFLPSRFRPVVERKTDISIFTAMLNTSKQGADA